MELQFLMPARCSFAAVALLLSALLSCEERIHIRTDASDPRLVIYGYITTDTARHGILITRSAGYFSTGRPLAVSGANVCIRCE